MSEPTNELAATLKQRGYSLTKPRQIVFKALASSEPLTMHEVVEQCAGIDRASIYRAIRLFESLGIVQRLQMGWKYKLELSDSFVHHHHHLSCTNCGRVIPLPEDEKLEQHLLTMAVSQNFTAVDHQLEIRGLCQVCSRQDMLTAKGVLKRA